MELTTCRETAFDVGPIPWTAIDAYGRRYGYEGEDFDSLLRLIRDLDEAYRTWVKSKQKKPDAGGTGGKPGAVQSPNGRPGRHARKGR
jgi:hypothetical protein